MLSHLLAAVLFSQGEIEAARGHVETSLAKRPGNAAAQLLAARIARAARDFDAALAHLDRAIAMAPQREAFVEKARTLDQASVNQTSLRPAARDAWQAILKVARRTWKLRRGSAGWHGKMAITRWPHRCWNARRRATLRIGLVSISDWSGRICTTTTKPPPPTARHWRKSPTMRGRAQPRHSAAGKRRSRRRDARLRGSLPAASNHVRHHRDGADLGAAWRLWLDETALRRWLGG